MARRPARQGSRPAPLARSTHPAEQRSQVPGRRGPTGFDSRPRAPDKLPLRASLAANGGGVMADDGDSDELRKRYMRYVVSPDLVDELTARRPPRRSRRVEGEGDGWHGMAGREEKETEPARSRVIVELDADFPGGVTQARAAVLARLGAIGVHGDRFAWAEKMSSRYNVFADLSLDEIDALFVHDEGRSGIYKVWPDKRLKPFLDRSVRTIKADACLTAFGADGRGIVVAVADSGIDGAHPHFATHANLVAPDGLAHRSFTDDSSDPLVDVFGHGTHVAGIVAGRSDPAQTQMRRVAEGRDGAGTVSTRVEPISEGRILHGVAPKAKVISLKVLDDEGDGWASALIAALEHVEELNDFGRRIRIHCVNLSLGYPFDAAWFAAGHSPLCAVVNRLSRSGTVVVAAAGNDGSALTATEFRKDRQRVGVDQSINDPGNAEEAITVGATHAEAPHRFGVSYFSSRGPTADGRVKPDMVAPGERILSCAAAASTKLLEALAAADAQPDPAVAYYREESGTSMAAPHVAGAVAALLSIRPEFVGRADAVKAVLVASCVDLKRKADFQGAGLLDMMRAIQSI